MRGVSKARIAGGIALIFVASWAYFASSAPDGSRSDLWRLAKPTLGYITQGGTVLLLLAATPLAKALMRHMVDPSCTCSTGDRIGVLCSVCRVHTTSRGRGRRKKGSRTKHGDKGEALKSLVAFVVDWTVPALAFITLFARGQRVPQIANQLWGSKGGVFFVWFYEILFRRHATTSAKSSALILFCYWLYVRLPAAVRMCVVANDAKLASHLYGL